LAVFDSNGHGKFNWDDAAGVITEIFRERKLLYKTLYDRENIGKIISRGLGLAYWFLMLIVTLTVFGVAVDKLLLSVGTIMVAFTFIFGNSLKTFWESFLFVLLVRPYDVGDRITLASYPDLIVSKINLLTTEAYTRDGQCWIIPNTIMGANSITQFKRSKDYVVKSKIALDINTTKEQIEGLKTAVKAWLAADKSTPWKHRQMFMWVSDLEVGSKIFVEISVELENVNWQMPELYLIPRSNFLLALQNICAQLGILNKTESKGTEKGEKVKVV